jgi:uncharacterized protein
VTVAVARDRERLARELVSRRLLIEHEASHAAAALCLGLQVTEARVDRPEEWTDGGVRMRTNGRVKVDRLAEHPREAALIVLAGPLTDPSAETPRWPLSVAPVPGSDEATLKALTEHLGYDKRDFERLLSDASELVARRDFDRAWGAFASALEARPVLDGEVLETVIDRITKERTPMEHKALAAETTVTDTELGEFEALVSAWDTDREGDTILRTSFDDTITAWRESGKMLPLLFEHSTDDVGHIEPLSLVTRKDGLVAAGKVDRSSEKEPQAWRQIKAGTAGFSIGYMAKDRPLSDGRREIYEIDLLEISITSTPMNAATRALSWESAVEREGDSLLALFRDLERRQRAGSSMWT